MAIRDYILLIFSSLFSHMFYHSILSPNIHILPNNISATPIYRGFKDIIFLKTHKTGGSTFTSIVLRNCIKYKLNCFIPPKLTPGKTWELNRYKDRIQIETGSGTYGGKYPYDLWCHHIVFDQKIFHLVKNTGKLVSIVRRPGNRFQSAWYWYDHGSSVSQFDHSAQLNMSLTEFIKLSSDSLADPKQTWLTNIRSKFKYRTGLDATSTELVGAN